MPVSQEKRKEAEHAAAFFGNAETFAEYEALREDSERVQFLYGLPIVQDLFRKEARLHEETSSAKSPHEAKRYKELGNEAFKSGKDEQALAHYHEAAAYAPRRPEDGGKTSVKVDLTI